jgi:phosphoglycolate phosphatase-like HAD superfamily hydrolase
MRLLALDFDGVISDSAPESFAVALETYALLRPESKHGSVAAQLFEARSRPELLAAIVGEPLYRAFLELMPLGNRAEDFAVALGILERGALVSEQADYDREWKSESEAFRASFHERFYQRRAAFAAGAPEAWRSLLSPYPEFIDLLRARSGDVVMAVATAKDRPSVLELLGRYGIAELFSDEFILDKETGVSKRAHLEALAQRSGLGFSEITFVDDKVNHLDDVASLGVRCALAGWGYNGERERALCAQRSYLVCELADVERQLFG